MGLKKEQRCGWKSFSQPSSQSRGLGLSSGPCGPDWLQVWGCSQWGRLETEMWCRGQRERDWHYNTDNSAGRLVENQRWQPLCHLVAKWGYSQWWLCGPHTWSCPYYTFVFNCITVQLPCHSFQFLSVFIISAEVVVPSVSCFWTVTPWQTEELMPALLL